MSTARDRIVAEARSWSGTPFHHAARLKGVGVDCAQFLIAVYSACELIDAIDVGYYAPDWFLHEDHERLLGWISRACVPATDPAPGDIAVFRYGRAASHGGIVLAWGDEGRVIHSFRGAGVVEEVCAPGTPLGVRLDSCWRFACLA